MEDEAYRRLAEHLDHLPGGFPPSDTGADLRLLRRLFTPAEAALATYLTLDLEDSHVIGARAGLPTDVAERCLGEMAQKGLIFATFPQEGLPLYNAVPWVVGIYELQVNNLTEGFRGDVADYSRTRRQSKPTHPQAAGQMRTIPISKSIETRTDVLPYEQIGELVAAQDRYAVMPCICRRHAKLRGDGCDAPEESCLSFGEWADYNVRTGRGRQIDRTEVMDILARADAANLVLQPSNSKEMSFVCTCCGCCCGVLKGLQRHPTPAKVVNNPFIAEHNSDTYRGCLTCLDRCQMQALTEIGGQVEFNADRCIGCGLCVSTCPSGSLKLIRKPESAGTPIAVDLRSTWRQIAQAQVPSR